MAKLTPEHEAFYQSFLRWYPEYSAERMPVVGFTGGRDYQNIRWAQFLVNALQKESKWKEEMKVSYHVGDCPTGLDYYVWTAKHYPSRDIDLICRPEFKMRKHIAKWNHFRALGNAKKAGPERNGQMLRAMLLESSKPVLFAFPGGDGTADCTRQARTLGIEIKHA